MRPNQAFIALSVVMTFFAGDDDGLTVFLDSLTVWFFRFPLMPLVDQNDDRRVHFA